MKIERERERAERRKKHYRHKCKRCTIEKTFFSPTSPNLCVNVANICINSLITIVFFLARCNRQPGSFRSFCVHANPFVAHFFPGTLATCEIIADRLGVAVFNKCKQNVSGALVFTLWFSVWHIILLAHKHTYAPNCFVFMKSASVFANILVYTSTAFILLRFVFTHESFAIHICLMENHTGMKNVFGMIRYNFYTLDMDGGESLFVFLFSFSAWTCANAKPNIN